MIHDGGISLSVRNDASFIVDARLTYMSISPQFVLICREKSYLF